MICRFCKQNYTIKSRFYFCCKDCYKKEKCRIKHQNKRKNQTDKLQIDIWFASLILNGFHCRFCERTDVFLDHIVPLSSGGTNRLNNIQPLCYNHNKIKTKIETKIVSSNSQKRREAQKLKRKNEELFFDLFAA